MIEDEVFKKEKLNKNKLLKYGFVKEKNMYKYSKEFMNGTFRADIFIDEKGKVTGKVYDLGLEEEYTNFRIKYVIGEFVNSVKEEYTKILEDVRNNCFEKEAFIFSQSNRMANFINEKYNVKPEFLWDKFPNYGVFRNNMNSKWFAVIMDIDKSKIIPKENGKIEILNLKLDNEIEKYLNGKGFYKAYHMSKKNWISIILNDTLPDEEIINLIDISYKNSSDIREWIFPVNPKYYDIIGAFEKTDIITWHKPKGILEGDAVYLYITIPYACIMFKCKVIETNSYCSDDSKERIKIKLLKKYKKDEFNIKKINECGVKSIRGPRRITSKLSEELKKCDLIY